MHSADGISLRTFPMIARMFAAKLEASVPAEASFMPKATISRSGWLAATASACDRPQKLSLPPTEKLCIVTAVPACSCVCSVSEMACAKASSGVIDCRIAAASSVAYPGCRGLTPERPEALAPVEMLSPKTASFSGGNRLPAFGPPQRNCSSNLRVRGKPACGCWGRGPCHGSELV